ncbi:MAG: trypsin-like serine protease [Polyangiales bacterium]
MTTHRPRNAPPRLLPCAGLSHAAAAVALSALMGGCANAEPLPVTTTSAAIIEGRADAGHAYVVALGRTGPRGDVFDCSGTVIDRHTVLTAFHCLRAGPITRVHFGPRIGDPDGRVIDALVPATSPAGARVLDSPVLHAVEDLAVLQLSEAAPVQPVPLLREALDNSSAFVGPRMTFVGFGTTNAAADSDGLCGSSGFGQRRVSTYPIDVVGPAQVEVAETRTVTLALDASLLIYFGQLREVAAGDSGGPMLSVQDGVERQAALTSFGVLECQTRITPALPGPGWGTQARTDQPTIDSFLQAQIDRIEGNNPCRNDGQCNPDCQAGQPDLVDPDCAAQHCGEDGVCAIACVDPLDPDCRKLGIDHCGEDGVCDPACRTDPDCALATHSGGGGCQSQPTPPTGFWLWTLLGLGGWRVWRASPTS